MIIDGMSYPTVTEEDARRALELFETIGSEDLYIIRAFFGRWDWPEEIKKETLSKDEIREIMSDVMYRLIRIVHDNWPNKNDGDIYHKSLETANAAILLDRSDWLKMSKR